jgi:hypothetical protein
MDLPGHEELPHTMSTPIEVRHDETGGSPTLTAARLLALLIFGSAFLLFFAVGVPLKPTLAFAAVVGTGAFLFLLGRPVLAACAMLSTLPFFSFLEIPVTRFGIKASAACTLLALGTWIVRLILYGEAERLTGPLSDRRFRWALGFAAVVVCSTILNYSASQQTMLSVAGFDSGSAYLVSSLRRQLSGVLLVLLILGLLRRRRDLDLGLKALFGAGAVVSIFGVIELVAHRSIFLIILGRRPPDLDESHPATLARLTGVEGDAPFHAYNIATYAALTLYFMGRTKRTGVRILLGLLLVAQTANVVGTGSRGGIVALLLVIAVFTWLRGGRKKFAYLVLIPAAFVVLWLGFLVMLPQYDIERVAAGFGDPVTDDARNFRMTNVPRAMAMFADHPLLGTGPQGFRINYFSYMTPEASREKLFDVHNTYVETLAAYGVLGAIAFFGLMFLHGRDLYRRSRLDADPDRRLLAAALLAMFAGFVLFAATSEGLTQPLLWVQLGLAGALAGTTERDGSDR